MNLSQLKKQSQEDMKGGEIGFSEANIDGRLVLVTAKKWGANQPGRKNSVRFTVTDKGSA